MSKKLIIFDRDGTINLDPYGYTHIKSQCKVYDDVLSFFSSLDTNINICVITNQSGIGRGYYTEKEMHEFNSEINKIIRSKTMHRGIDHFFFCPHLPSDKCNCRKPRNQLVKKALKLYKCEPNQALLIGDKFSDFEAGSSAGVQSILLNREGKLDLVKLKTLKVVSYDSLDFNYFKSYLV